MGMLFRKAPTFAVVAHQVLRLKELKSPRTYRNAKWQIDRLVRFFGDKPIQKITEDQWATYVARESKRRRRKFYDDRKYMGMCLRYAHRKGFVRELVPLAIPDPPWDAGRELSSFELARVRKAARREGEKSRDLLFQIDIAWKMGLRLNEMLRLRWDQFNWEAGTIRLRAGDTKTRKGREIPINPDLLPEFSRRRPAHAALWVFPNRKASGPVGSNKTAWKRCKRDAGVKCRWHDLRHTCATKMLRAGAPRHVVKGYLGMSELVLDRIYSHLDLTDMRHAALLMTDHVLPARASARV